MGTPKGMQDFGKGEKDTEDGLTEVTALKVEVWGKERGYNLIFSGENVKSEVYGESMQSARCS